MGFGSIIATAIAIVVLMAAGYLLIGGVTQSADTAGASMKAAAGLQDQRLRTVLAIDPDSTASNWGEGWFSFHLQNKGSEKIANITAMDVIVKMTGPNGSAHYVPYRSPGGGTPIYWESGGIGSIAAGIGDAVNPGMLDPGEYVAIIVHEEGGFPSHTAWVQVTAPNGAPASGNLIIT